MRAHCDLLPAPRALRRLRASGSPLRCSSAGSGCLRAQLELCPHRIALRPLSDVFNAGEALLTSREGGSVLAHQLMHAALFAEEACIEERGVVARQIASRLQRGECALIRPNALTDLTERFLHPRDLARIQVEEVLPGGQRAFVQLRGNDVRECRLCALASRNRVAPCLGVITRLEEVKREQWRHVVAPRLQRSCHPAVDISPTLERKSFVCGGADELVPEYESAVSRLIDELVQRVPRARIVDVSDLAFEDPGEKAGLEGRAYDCGAPEQHAVGRMKCVDACGEKAFHGAR